MSTDSLTPFYIDLTLPPKDLDAPDNTVHAPPGLAPLLDGATPDERRVLLGVDCPTGHTSAAETCERCSLERGRLVSEIVWRWTEARADAGGARAIVPAPRTPTIEDYPILAYEPREPHPPDFGGVVLLDDERRRRIRHSSYHAEVQYSEARRAHARAWMAWFRALSEDEVRAYGARSLTRWGGGANSVEAPGRRRVMGRRGG
jgi:hypothetical protein